MPTIGGSFGERIDLQVAGAAGSGPSPGAGSSGFSSRVMVWADSSGALFSNSSGPQWDSTLNRMGVGTSVMSALIHVSKNTTEQGIRAEGQISTADSMPHISVGNLLSTAGTPSAMFTFLGQGLVNGGFAFTPTGGSDAKLSFALTGNGNPANGGNDLFTVRSTGGTPQVGIGTTTPTANLFVQNSTATSTAAGIVVNGPTGNRGILEISAGSTVGGRLMTNGSGLLFIQGGGGGLADHITVNSSGHVGINTTVPAVPLHVRTPAGGGDVMRLMSSNGADIAFIGATTQGMLFRTRSSVSLPAGAGAEWHFATTVNGDAFRVTATTGGANVAINVHSTGSTQRIGFWTTVGSVRPSSYTPAGTSGRTVPSTNIAAGAAEINQLIGVVRTMLKDFSVYGLLST